MFLHQFCLLFVVYFWTATRIDEPEKLIWEQSHHGRCERDGGMYQFHHGIQLTVPKTQGGEHPLQAHPDVFNNQGLVKCHVVGKLVAKQLRVHYDPFGVQRLKLVNQGTESHGRSDHGPSLPGFGDVSGFDGIHDTRDSIFVQLTFCAFFSLGYHFWRFFLLFTLSFPQEQEHSMLVLNVFNSFDI